MELNTLILASKITLISIPIVIILAGLWWIYIES
jgi:hypothetical protein